MSDAIERSIENKKKIDKGLKKPKNRVGNFSSYNIDSSLITQALQWTEESVVTWQHLGRQFVKDRNGNIPANCGQIAKEYLLHREQHSSFQFTLKGKNEAPTIRPRRCRKRLFSSVSAPEDLSSKKIKILIEDMVREGEIDIGENVVEKIIVKRKIDKLTGSCVTDTFSVHARKHPLSKLRVKLFDMHKQYMRLNSDSYFENISQEELTQRFQFIDEYSQCNL